MCALLNDAGIEARLENWYYATLDAFMVPALSGVGVLAPGRQADEARALIIQYVESAEERLRQVYPELDTAPIKRNHWGAFTLIGLSCGWTYFPAALLLATAFICAGGLLTDQPMTLGLELALSQFATLAWLEGLYMTAGSLVTFLVPLGFFVFLARRFLNKRASQKQPI